MKLMSFNRFKNVLIILLAMSSVYLTSVLWFDRFANRNFIHSLASSFMPSQAESLLTAAHVLKPMRIFSGDGSGAFGVVSSGRWSAVRQACDAAVMHGLSGSAALSVESLDWEAVLNGKCFVYEYAFSVPSEFFIGVMHVKNASFTQRIDVFDTVVIRPDAATGQTAVTFVGSQSQTACTLVLDEAETASRLVGELDESPVGAPDGLSYTHASASDVPGLAIGSFFPGWGPEGYAYYPLAARNPYAPKGDLTLPTIESMVGYLFDSPEQRYSGRTNGIYTFSNESAVIRYFPNDTLEYASYKPSGNGGQKSAAAMDYFAALSFLSEDTTIANDYYLSGIEETDGVATFYFDFIVNGLPLKMSESYAADIGMKSPLRVSVENRAVTKYKKLAYNFYEDVESGYMETAAVSFKECYDSVVSHASAPQDVAVTGVYLCYKMENTKNMRLNWFIDVNGRTGAYPVQFWSE